MKSYAPADWRLILDPSPKPGARNMAMDEAILRAVAAGHAPPTLRLYTWSPPALVLGRGQPVADADIVALIADNITLLRRMTGGTAVYHDKTALTYMVAAPNDEPRFAGDVTQSYQGISTALTTALAYVGLQHAQGESPPPPRASGADRDPVCFLAPATYEIVVSARKLVGSAQMRVRGGILQHGTLYLRGDIARISNYLSAHPDPAQIRAHALSLCDAIQHDISWDEMAQAMIDGFHHALNINFTRAPLLPTEHKDVEYLLSEKYTCENWTRRL